MSFVSASGGSSDRRHRRMGFCLSVSRRSTRPCRAAGSRGVPCTRSWEQGATKKTVRSPLPLAPISSDGLGLRRYCGACLAWISTVLVLPRTGSILGGSCWSGHRATPRSYGRWRKGCALPASPRWSVKSDPSPWWRAAVCNSPRNAPALSPFCCGVGVRAGRRRVSALCRTQP